MNDLPCAMCGAPPYNRKQPLTAKQTAVLDRIRLHIQEHGYAPTHQELAFYFGNALSTTWATVDVIVKKGHIRKKTRDWRSMEIL